ncbi:MAG: phosphoserine phosphatase SerB [Candidatus Latescibacterota bacterium]|jgi:phosphoserine phosphatase
MPEKKDYVVVTVSGRDRPGITAAFSRILVQHGVEIADIDQAALRDFLALTFLLDLSGDNAGRDTVLKDLLFEAHRLGMNLDFQPLSEKQRQRMSGQDLFVVTFFGNTEAMAAITGTVAGENGNILKISNLAGRTAKGPPWRAECVELLVAAQTNGAVSRIKDRLMTTSHEMGVDLAIQSFESHRKGKRIVFFDMDQTLLDMEVIDEMAAAAGVGGEVSRVTQKAMRGDLDFEESLRQRVALLKGLDRAALERIRSNLRLSEGSELLVSTLKRLGFVLGVVSGGFMFYAGHLEETLGLDFAYANELEFKGDKLTGRVIGEVVDDAKKAKIVNRESAKRGIPLDQAVAIGDGANDRLMLGQAGLGVAYNAGRGLERSAGSKLARNKLKNILYILGITDDDIGDLRV